MKYKKVSICPPELEKLIERVNFVPAKIFFPDVETVMNNVYFEQTGRKMPFFDTQGDYSSGKYKTGEERTLHENTLEKALEIIKESTKTFPELYSYLFEKPNGISAADWYIHYTYVQNPLDAYIEYFDLKRQLRYIADKCTSFVNKVWGEINGIAFPAYEMDFTQTLYFRIIENKITFVPNKIISLLQGIDARRLRVCPICDAVFWAKRIEAKTCSKRRCLNNFHQRKRRTNEYEKRLAKECKKLQKQRKSLPENHALITEQTMRVNKLTGKIKAEKNKNGTL